MHIKFYLLIFTAPREINAIKLLNEEQTFMKISLKTFYFLSQYENELLKNPTLLGYQMVRPPQQCHIIALSAVCLFPLCWLETLPIFKIFNSPELFSYPLLMQMKTYWLWTLTQLSKRWQTEIFLLSAELLFQLN